MEKLIKILEDYKNDITDIDGAIDEVNKLMKNNELFDRESAIKLVNRAFFFLSDNGDEDMSGREYMDMMYEVK